MLFSGQTFGVLRVARETVRSSHAEVRLAPLSLRAEPGHRWNLTETGEWPEGFWKVSGLPLLVSPLVCHRALGEQDLEWRQVLSYQRHCHLCGE